MVRGSRKALLLSMMLSGLLVLILAAPASAATTTYKVTFRDGEYFENDANGDGDTDDRGDSEGGMFGLKKGGEKVGHINFNCTVTEIKPPRDLCWAVARIKGKGQVVIHGLGASNTDLFIGAITGGTGAYRGASGVMKFNFRQSTVTLEID